MDDFDVILFFQSYNILKKTKGRRFKYIIKYIIMADKGIH